MRASSPFISGLALLVTSMCQADDAALLSGPQPGETLPPFSAAGLLGGVEGRQVDIVTKAAGKPVLIVFVHDPLTRPTAAVTRAISDYAAGLGDKVQTLVVVLNADRALAEDYVRRVQGPLRLKTPVAVALEGAEGPTAYGLNRSANLTVIIGNRHLVTGNFALVQPSLSDVPDIAREIAKAAGVEPPAKEYVDQLLAGADRQPVK